MVETPRLVTQGARMLRALLKRRGITLNAFCVEHKLDYAWVHRNITGERGQRISVDFATKIHEASDGEIPLLAWASETLAPIEDESAEVQPAEAT